MRIGSSAPGQTAGAYGETYPIGPMVFRVQKRKREAKG